jgi:hypothetical protein
MKNQRHEAKDKPGKYTDNGYDDKNDNYNNDKELVEDKPAKHTIGDAIKVAMHKKVNLCCLAREPNKCTTNRNRFAALAIEEDDHGETTKDNDYGNNNIHRKEFTENKPSRYMIGDVIKAAKTRVGPRGPKRRG